MQLSNTSCKYDATGSIVIPAKAIEEDTAYAILISSLQATTASDLRGSGDGVVCDGSQQRRLYRERSARALPWHAPKSRAKRVANALVRLFTPQSRFAV